MYTPPAFVATDTATLHDVMRANGFALLVSATPDGPLATHLPMMLVTPPGGPAAIVGHMARANPHWQALEREPPALVVFSGPHAYVSPSWYAAGPAVPTWNYVAVHAYGRAELITEPAALESLLRALVERHEQGRDPEWRFDSLPAEFRDRQIRGIVGFRITIDRLEGKLKLSQNRPPGDADRVARRLAAAPTEIERDTAAAMRRYGAAPSED